MSNSFNHDRGDIVLPLRLLAAWQTSSDKALNAPKALSVEA
jgi:hypothetical protein